MLTIEDAELLHGDITDKIIGAGLEIMRTLGYGFMEKVYENALVIELQRVGLRSCSSNQLKSSIQGR